MTEQKVRKGSENISVWYLIQTSMTHMKVTISNKNRMAWCIRIDHIVMYSMQGKCYTSTIWYYQTHLYRANTEIRLKSMNGNAL